MGKNKNNLKNEKNRNQIGEWNYLIKLQIKKNFILRLIKKLEKVISIIVVIVPIILVFIATYNEINSYIWFGEKVTVILYLISIFVFFVLQPLVFKLGVIANTID